MTTEQAKQFAEGQQAGIDEIGKTNPLHHQWDNGAEQPSPEFEAGYWKGYLSGPGKWSLVSA